MTLDKSGYMESARTATKRYCQHWEDFVARFQESGSGKRSDEKWQLMERIYCLTDCLSTM